MIDAIDIILNYCQKYGDDPQTFNRNQVDAAIAQLAALRAGLTSARAALEYISKRSDFQIPSYAYADNQAGCYMAGYLNEIENAADTWLDDHPEQP
jgi:hypothetical protein